MVAAKSARTRLIETVRLGAAVAVASGEVRQGWLPNRLPAVCLALERCACPAGPCRGVARKRDERPPQVWYKACPPRLPEYLVMILECVLMAVMIGVDSHCGTGRTW